MNYNLTIDEAVDFLLTKSRDEKENQSKYLGIIKLLYSLNNYHYSYAGIPYIANDTEKNKDINWTVTSTCDSKTIPLNKCVASVSSNTNGKIELEDLATDLAERDFKALKDKLQEKEFDVFKAPITGETDNGTNEFPF